jgi:glutamate formiminotransferase
VLEAVPNVSEGRSAQATEAIGEAFAKGPRLLDTHSDADHNRSVFTLAGEAGALVSGLVAGVARACELIDLRRHEGVHPRVGAADVVPVVPLEPAAMEEAKAAALAVAESIGDEVGMPVFLYGEVGEGRRPAFFRRGGLDELRRRVEAGELESTFGPHEVGERAGAVLVGARKPLVAYNVVLETGEAELAKAVAAAVRESSGGLAGVQAIGLRLPTSGRIQVSMNVIDLDRTPLHELYARVVAEAAARGVGVREGELVGLVPERVLTEAEAAGCEVPGVDESRVLERALGL